MSQFRYRIKELEAEVDLKEYLREYVDVPKFLSFCQACPNYGGAWSCPPLEFDPLALWRRYGSMKLYARMLLPIGAGQEAGAAIKALEEEKNRGLEILLQREANIPGSLALAAGSCTLCPRCARKDGLPCRTPERVRCSIESLGGDVGLTASRYLGKPLLWIKNGVVPEYLMLVGALLLPVAGGK